MEIDDLIGVPFIDGGRDITKGLDCAGVVLEVLRRFGVDIDDERVGIFKISACGIGAFETEKIQQVIDYCKESDDWESIDEPEPGCVLVMRTENSGNFYNHFGVCVGGNRFIHTYKKCGGVILTRLDDPVWRNRIEGFYLWKGKN